MIVGRCFFSDNDTRLASMICLLISCSSGEMRHVWRQYYWHETWFGACPLIRTDLEAFLGIGSIFEANCFLLKLVNNGVCFYGIWHLLKDTNISKQGNINNNKLTLLQLVHLDHTNIQKKGSSSVGVLGQLFFGLLKLWNPYVFLTEWLIVYCSEPPDVCYRTNVQPMGADTVAVHRQPVCVQVHRQYSHWRQWQGAVSLPLQVVTISTLMAMTGRCLASSTGSYNIHIDGNDRALSCFLYR